MTEQDHLVENILSVNQSNCTVFNLADPQLKSAEKFVHFVLIVFLSTLSAFSILANAIVFISLILSQTNRMQGIKNASKKENTITLKLMAAMAFSDLALGVIVLPKAVAEIIENPHKIITRQLSKSNGLMSVFWCTVSMYSMTSLAVDRYIAACWPFLYRSMSSRLKCAILGVNILTPLIISTYTTLSGIYLLPFYHVDTCGYPLSSYEMHPVFVINIFISLYIPMSAMLVLYYKVFQKIKRRTKISPVNEESNAAPGKQGLGETTENRHFFVTSFADTQFKLQANSSPTSSPSVTGYTDLVDFTSRNENLSLCGKDASLTLIKEAVTAHNGDEGNQNQTHDTLKTNKDTQVYAKIKAERVLLMIVLCFIVSWLPMTVATTVSFSVVTPLPNWASALVNWMGYGNSALNPVLFCCHREVWLYVRWLLRLNQLTGTIRVALSNVY